MILVIDNYDSFTYNLVQALFELGESVCVRRNDAVSVAGALVMGASHIVISPGPGRPEDAGITVELIREAAVRQVPVLGVCLGHQAIASAFGGRVVRAPVPVHGKTSPIEHDGRGLFEGVRQGFAAGRYHSLAVARDALPDALQVSARVKGSDIVMGLRHRTLPLHGVQFHPESILTEAGQRILGNFVKMRLEPPCLGSCSTN